MRRVLLVVGAMAVIAAVAVLVGPGRHGKPDAKALLMGVAEAMEHADSLYMGGRTGTPQGLMPGVTEMWLGERARATRFYDKGSGALIAAKADLDAKQWWYYSSGNKTLYRADLTPVMDKAGKAVPLLLNFYRSGGLTERFLKNWPQQKHELITEKRDGREVALLTFFFEQELSGPPPQHVVDRNVFVISLVDDGLLAQQRYFRFADGKENLIEDWDKIRQGEPVASDQELLAPAKEIHEAKATVLIDKTEHGLFLRLAADGKPITPGSALTTLEVPRG